MTSTTIPYITVLGSLNMDLVAYVPYHPVPGETLTADTFVTTPGGKGANQAVACAKLSRSRAELGTGVGETARVAMVGCVGTDGYGSQLRSNLASYGVDVSGVEEREGLTTGTAMIIVDKPTGENRIVVSPGANYALHAEELSTLDRLRAPQSGKEGGEEKEGEEEEEEEEEGKGAQKLPDLLIMQLEIPFETVLAALAAARREGVDVLLNPAPARRLPDEAYVGLAHLVVNETEAAILGEVEERELERETGLEKVGKEFIRKGVRNVIITLGARGVYYRTKDGKRGLVPAEKARVIDTTAAGDTFVGRYALDAVMAKKNGEPFDIDTAVRKANRAAAKTVEKAGAQDSIPWRDEIE